MDKKQFDKIFNEISVKQGHELVSRIEASSKDDPSMSYDDLLPLLVHETTVYTNNLVYEILTSVLPLDD